MKKKKLQTVIFEAKKGKRQAQNLLMDIFWDNVFNYVYQKIKDEEEAEDIAIETFTKVFAKLKLYNADFDFKTWLLSIAHNTMIDHIRKKPALKISLDDENYVIEIQEELPSPEDSLIQQQDNDALILHLQKLKPEYRKIIELRFLEEKTYKEIAEELDLTLANVKVRILRAKQLLQEILNG
ncbi:RNA polymerase sigma factor [Moheibacter lacus]|uniref:Sigma-70 family RNA polymerase sigma factor n=1 Tax=Moheibacter lacus TaxID=2745851 RepID=A0A838ZGK9_9FLAO|nr:sigma-70 family RNA polymerase sigma factor [Moheibacter lacus]MBA5628408.1 sigma-70 family RNA polymerase sigma factor [Moheibacter lacus]